MEQVSLKNSTAVCNNTLASEVNQMSSNVLVTKYPKSTCRIKNGLINGVADDKNHSKATLLTNQDMRKSISDVPKDKHNQHLSQSCMDSCAVFQQSIGTSLNCKTDIGQNDSVCTGPSNSKSKTKCKKKVILNCGDKYMEDASEIGLNTNLDELCNKPNTNVLENSTEDILESDKDLVGIMRNLKLENCIRDCVQSVCDSAVEEEVQETYEIGEITYVQYESELQMPLIMKIIQKDLSEPYSIYTYRYFIHNWPKLCFLAMCGEECVGAIVCKLDYHRKSTKRGYIAMLAVDQHYRKRKIGSTLVRRAIQEMIAGNADEVVLETEVTNKSALRLYELLGFVRDKRLFRYYLNGVDALRLKLWLR